MKKIRKQAAQETSRNVLQLKVTLNDSRPPIWRRIQILDTSTFFDLHNAIRDAMGWEDYHLHGFAFETKGTKRPILIGPSSEDSFLETLPEKKQLVKDWLGQKSQQCVYTYDYGDNWDHTVLLEKVLLAEPGVEYPRCVAGKRVCPPEDSGGIGGYEYKLKVMKHPKHKEYTDTLEWMGEDFDAEEFDSEDVIFNGNMELEKEEPEDDEDKELPIEGVDDAIFELDHPGAGIPFAAITYLREAKSSKDLIEHIAYVLENAYDDRMVNADIFHDTSPLWYAVVAEKHLDERLIGSAVRLLTSTAGDWDFLNEQAQYLVCLLAERYPDETARATMHAIDAAIQLRLKSPYLFLFDVFMVVDAKKYESWLLELAANPANEWRGSLAQLLSDVRLESAVPVLEKLLKAMRADKASQNPFYDESNDVEAALEELKGTRKRYEEQPQPEYKTRGDWEAHYRRFEDRFTDEDKDDDVRYTANKPYVAPPKVGRNEPCPCGSGQKYKKCHGVV